MNVTIPGRECIQRPTLAIIIHALASCPNLRQFGRVLKDEETTPEQYEAYRRMTPGERLEMAEQLYWTARELKAAGLRHQHPDWSEEEVAREVTRIFTHART